MNRFLVLIILLVVCLSANAQTISIEVQDKPLKEVVEYISRKAKVNFVYTSKAVKDATVSCKINDQEIEEAMDTILASTSLDYKRIDNTFLLKEKTFRVPHTSYKIKGIVSDKNMPLVSAIIYVENTSLGTYTDENGAFQLEIPKEYIHHNLIISYIGYEESTYKMIDFKDELILAHLKEMPYSVNEVVILNKEKVVKVMSYDQATTLKLTNYGYGASSLAGGDFSKSLQLTAGISAFDDTSAAIKIRGSNADATLMILDGMPLYGTSHYYGIFSALNPSYVNEVDIYKNNIPLQYGNKTAGVVNVKSDNSISDKPQGDVEVNLLTTSLHTRIPIGSQTSISFAGRKTIRNISNTQFNTFAPERERRFAFNEAEEEFGFSVVDPEFSFLDINAHLNHKFDEENYLSFNVFKSSDHFESEFYSEYVLPNQEVIRLENSDKENWSNNSFSLLSENRLGKHNLHTSIYSTRFERSTYLDIDVNEKEEEINMTDYGLIHDLGFDTHLDFDLKSDSLTVGLGIINHNYDYSFNENRQSVISDTGNGTMYSIYGNFASGLYNNFQFNSGVRLSYYDLVNQWFVSPRLSLNYNLSETTRLKTSYGFYNQNIRELNYEYQGEVKSIWVSANDDIPTLYAHNTMLGFTKVFEHFTLDVEGYYKKQLGVMELVSVFPERQPNTPDQSPDDQFRLYDLFEGEGRSYGIDVMFSSGYNDYNTYLAYTLSRVEDSYKEISQGNYLPAESDRRHQLKWINTYDFNNIRLSADYIFASGRRYTNLIRVNKDGDGDIRDTKNRFDRLKPYNRLDLGMQYRIELKGNSSLDLGCSVLNVFNTRNIKYKQSVVSTSKEEQPISGRLIGNESSLLARTVNFLVKFTL